MADEEETVIPIQIPIIKVQIGDKVIAEVPIEGVGHNAMMNALRARIRSLESEVEKLHNANNSYMLENENLYREIRDNDEEIKLLKRRNEELANSFQAAGKEGAEAFFSELEPLIQGAIDKYKKKRGWA